MNRQGYKRVSRLKEGRKVVQYTYRAITETSKQLSKIQMQLTKIKVKIILYFTIL